MNRFILSTFTLTRQHAAALCVSLSEQPNLAGWELKQPCTSVREINTTRQLDGGERKNLAAYEVSFGHSPYGPRERGMGGNDRIFSQALDEAQIKSWTLLCTLGQVKLA